MLEGVISSEQIPTCNRSVRGWSASTMKMTALRLTRAHVWAMIELARSKLAGPRSELNRSTQRTYNLWLICSQSSWNQIMESTFTTTSSSTPVSIALTSLWLRKTPPFTNPKFSPSSQSSLTSNRRRTKEWRNLLKRTGMYQIVRGWQTTQFRIDTRSWCANRRTSSWVYLNMSLASPSRICLS